MCTVLYYFSMRRPSSPRLSTWLGKGEPPVPLTPDNNHYFCLDIAPTLFSKTHAPFTVVQALPGGLVWRQGPPHWTHHFPFKAAVSFWWFISFFKLNKNYLHGPKTNHSPDFYLIFSSFLVFLFLFSRSVKRVWVPNVQRKSLWSDSLGRCLSLKVTTFALREMDRMGKIFFHCRTLV